MKIIKPSQLSLLTRPYRELGREWLGIAAVALVDMSPTPLLHQESELWEHVQAYMAGLPLDAGLPKAHPEYLVAARAWGCYADADGGSLVAVRVGDLHKSLRVCGPRIWQSGHPGPAQPYTSFALDWAHAYGGPELAENPLGQGMQVVRDDQGRKVQPLPQIEYPDRGVNRPHQIGVPAGLLPLPSAHPRRRRQYGTPDRSWLERNYPGYPADRSEGYFNVAPLDQQWPTDATALCQAGYSLLNLHPTRPLLEGHLPALQIMALVGQRGHCQAQVHRLNLTTACFFPAVERIALIFHGRQAMQCFDAADMEYLMLAAEHPDRPRPESTYHELCHQRLQPGQPPTSWPRDEALVAAELLPPLAAPSALQRGSIRRRHQQAAAAAQIEQARQTLARHQLDDADFIPAPPILEPAPLNSPADVARLREHARQQQAHASEQEAKVLAQRKELLARAQAEGQDTEALEAAYAQRPAGPPRPDPQLQSLFEVAPPGMDVEAMKQQWQQAPLAMRQSYQHAAQYQPPLERQSVVASQAARQALERDYRAGRSLRGRDLSGLSLTGIDLRGADLQGVLLESADLSHARLDGCDLTQAMLSRSLLKQACLRGARLEGTNLAAATLEDTDLGEARLEQVILDHALLRRCELAASQWRQCRCSQTRLEQLDLQQATLAEMVFDSLLLQQIQARGSQWRKLALVKCQLQDVDLSASDIEGLALVACQLDHGCRFSDSRLHKSCFVEACQFDRPDFSGAQLSETNLRGVQLAGVSLAHARLRACDLSDASLAGGDLRGCHFEQVQMVRTDFSDADLRDADLMGAYMRGACLDGADFRRANLFRAQLGEVRMDPRTRFDQAYLERFIAYPLLDQRDHEP